MFCHMILFINIFFYLRTLFVVVTRRWRLHVRYTGQFFLNLLEAERERFERLRATPRSVVFVQFRQLLLALFIG